MPITHYRKGFAGQTGVPSEFAQPRSEGRPSLSDTRVHLVTYSDSR